MFSTNEGTLDRVLRVIVGAALLIWFFYDTNTAGFWHYAKLIGIVPLVTGLVGTCPIYALLGVTTCPTRNA